MYSHEIEQLLKIRNYLIDSEEYLNILRTSPQINYVEYKPFEDNFEMRTDDRYYFKYKVYRKDKNN